MLDKIINIAKTAGSIIMKYHCQELEIKTKSHEHDFVTQADIEADKYIREELNKLFPKDKILSEEFDWKPKDYSGNVWMVDPLDGSKDFVHQGGGFSVMIGLCVDGIPYLGVVYAPARDLLYYAQKNNGAYLIKGNKKEKLKVSQINQIENSTMVTRIIHGEPRDLDRIVYSLKFKKEIKESSVGIKLGLITESKADLHINTNFRCSKWDTCAPQIILEEAGGHLTDLEGKSLNYKQKSIKWEKSFVASNNILHPEVIKKIQSFEND